MKDLNDIAYKVMKCKECRLWKNSTHGVPGEGSAKAKIMFIGEAPGAEEDRQGRPFVGRAGKILDKLLEKNKIDRKKVFITNIVKHRPPENRRPEQDEIEACKVYLFKQIKIIKPKIVVLLGDVASTALLGKVKLKNIHGKQIKQDKIIYMPTYHPSAARFLKIKNALEKDFEKLSKINFEK